MEQLDKFVKRLQVNLLLEFRQATSQIPDVQKVTDYINILGIINEEFKEHYSVDVSSYKELAKEFNFVGKLPLRE